MLHRSSSLLLRAAVCGIVGAIAVATSASAATGDLEPGFSGDGIATATGGPVNATAVTVQPDGMVVAAGTGAFDDGSVSKVGTYVARYTTVGAPDPSFGNGGFTIFNAMPAFEAVRGVAIDGSGRVLVSGYGTGEGSDESDVDVVRLTATGAVDKTFGGGDGIAVIDMGNHDRAGRIAVRGTRIFVAASQDDGGNFANEWTLLALTQKGVLDKKFSGDGKAEVPTTKISTFDSLRDLAVQPDGKIVLGGSAGSAFAAARMTAQGVLDASFDGDGVATSLLGGGGAGSRLLLQPDGKVIIAGYATQTGHPDSDFAAVRFTGSGGPDATFGTGGKVAIDVSGASNDRALGGALAADGKIVLGGFTNPAAGMDFATVRLNWDGTRDTSFSGDGIVVTNTLATSNEQIEAMATGPGDRVYGVGENLNGWAIVAYTGGANTRLTATNAKITEPDSGTASLAFKIKLAGPRTSTVTVAYATKDGTAKAPGDYTARTGTVTFAPGATSATVTVPVVGDTAKEPNEKLTLVLSNPTNAGLAQATATGTIVNDD